MADEVPEISVAELKARLDRGDRIAIIDVREPAEWQIANLEEYGARLIPMSQLVDRIEEIDPGEEIVLQCRSGNRSGQVLKYLQSRGYARVWNLEGGILAWSDQIYPSKRKY